MREGGDEVESFHCYFLCRADRESREVHSITSF
jgi:hypothetical protein